jgi:pimeloyl-ACP methyl ester carboxylesterase
MTGVGGSGRLRHFDVEVEPGVSLHCVEAGEGPLVLFLHGFPDFWYGWRRQLPALAAAGFRAVAPDLRGYGTSSKPRGVSSYGVRTLVGDVASLVEKLGAQRAHVVGHDMGAGLAWAFAMMHPDRLGRLGILNGPHPERMMTAMRDPVQLAKSWYVFALQVPWFPEQILRMDDYGVLTRAIRDEPTNRAAVTPEDLALYREAWSRPGALEAMLSWYRALFRPGALVPVRPIEAPALVLWGEAADPHLGPGLATPSASFVPDARVVMLPGASHWVQHDEAERVNAELVRFLNSV